MTENALLNLVPLLPLLGAILVGLMALGASHKADGPPKGIVSLIACLMPVLSFVISVYLFLQLQTMPADNRVITATLFEWFRVGDVSLGVDFYLDQLSAVMILVVTGIGSLIHIYSVGYMSHDRGFARFFAYLNLFTFSMLVLVLAQNLVLMFVGWEGVGVCSYLLIGFWFQNQDYVSAANKAFIMNRVGDFGFLLGLFTLYWFLAGHNAATFDIPTLKQNIHLLPAGVALAVALLLFVGVSGKSAQLPLHTWLPDAMAGPTPVSALIHAATMVTAGVYLITRMNFLYALAPTALGIIAVIGAVTAIFAATIAIAQNDIKKVLAYSTLSQLGYMFLAVGIGAYTAAIFHLFTHAFFKALLFLGSGSVIHALHGEQDMSKMGGLRKKLPLTFWTFLIGTLAIAGIPPLAGFFSKDEILWQAWSGGHVVLYGIGIVTALLTAFYMGRLLFLTFWGEPRDKHLYEHAHESPPVMSVPLVILAVGSATVGFLGLPHFLGHNLFADWLAPVVAAHGAHGEAAAHGSASTEALLAGLSVVLAIAGLAYAYSRFAKGVTRLPAETEPGRPLHNLLSHKYYVDEIYNALIVAPMLGISRRLLWRGIDESVIDGVVNGAPKAYMAFSSRFRKLQTGWVRAYAYFIMIGLLAFFIYYHFGQNVWLSGLQ